ncbi:metallophosphoesterase [Agromyces sp. ISL-38]|uniref:metallophosphoesterase n=1 Tax=Agromyces sp. ISL-38 TaxID=2819107 RepID=UPI001BE9C2C0|nr:metallophosphoesterase [Agromyces sp. ISL-38]MBT2498932.1 metallophosphoesterase [Agromyces sp. ISL-38]
MSRPALPPAARIALAIGAAGAAVLAWGSLVERTRWTLRRADVAVLPPGAAPIRVLHLSDLHMAPWQRDKQDWVRSLAALEPDLIVDTGDNLGHERGLEGIRRAFEPFRGIPGVFVNGSNDYFGPTIKNPFAYFGGPSGYVPRSKPLDIDALHSYLADLGWNDLDNTAASLDLRGTHFEFFGVDDPHRGFDRLDLITGAIDELRAEDPLGDETWPDAASVSTRRPTVTIGVTHAPYQRVLTSFVNHGAELILAGHTHGGQVCLPGFGALVTNCDIPRSQVKGLSVWRHGLRSAFLNVSAGLGTSIYAPVRFACPPEATLLTLLPTE